jgi:glycosyltransferase involved in cell wall biosynthesis
MSQVPLVSIIIPTYNYARYIGEAIDSILNSQFPQDEIEIIVVDDGSTDNTQAVIQQYGERIKYLWQANQGKAWATKVGIEHTQGKYVFNLDADDYFLPLKISKIVEIFEQNQDIVHVAHPAMYWDVERNTKWSEVIPDPLLNTKLDGKHLLSFFYRRKMLFGGGSTFAARGNVLKQLPITKAVDMFIDEFLVLFTLNSGCSYFIREPLSVWRIHGTNYSGNQTNRSLAQKLERSLDSRKAVLDALFASDFEPEIQRIYELNLKVMTITAKEQLGQKQVKEVMDLWMYLFKNRSSFKGKLLSIIKAYTLLNRTLPTSLLQSLRRIKQA